LKNKIARIASLQEKLKEIEKVITELHKKNPLDFIAIQENKRLRLQIKDELHSLGNTELQKVA